MSADRNLLFGVLALQNNFVTRDQLVEAMNAWGISRERPLGELLRERGALAEDEHALIEGLVQRQLRRHQGDVGKSLRGLEVSSSARRALAKLSDPEVQASLAHLATPSTEVTTDHVPRHDGEGLRYRVLRPHARGGLGEVFVAEDTQLHREVALKEIQPERAGDPGSRGRFLLEAEVTGRLEHPGIVPVYGLGSYADGRPFYAMRFVRGDNLKHAIERFHQSKEGFDGVAFRAVLRRFLDVCNAVAYAHSRGVLHRDLKPGNVMLGEFGETLLVDWGLAKVVGRSDPKEGEATLRLSSGSGVAQTVAGSAIGTPAYMSPEQAEGRLDALGPATDVYSLGATLYCVLTGRPPVPGDDVAEVLGRVRRGDVAPAERVRTDVPRPLAAVCRKAMALRPEDRYPSAGALAADVEHWLADEPVTAYQDPPLVQFARWRRKNRTLVTAASAVLLVSLAGLAVGLAVVGGLNRKLEAANAELQASNERLDETNGKLNESNTRLAASLAETERERAVAVAVNDFLQRDLLGQADIGNQPLGGEKGGRDPNVTVAELLGRAAKAVEGRFPGQPETEAAVRCTVGDAYRALGRYEEAQLQLERSVAVGERRLGADHSSTLTSKNNLALLYSFQGRNDKAEPLFLEVLRQLEKKRGADHPATLISKNNLAALYYHQGRTDKAEPLYLEVLRQRERKLGADHPDTLSSKNNLALLYHSQGRTDKAEPLYLEVLRQLEKKRGADHPDTLSSKNNLAGLYGDQAKYDKAEPLYLEVLRQRERKLGADHPDTLSSKNNLAGLYGAQAKYDQAERLYLEVLRLSEKKLGADHPKTLQILANLGVNYRDAGRLDDAVRCLEDALARDAKRPGGLPTSPPGARGALAAAYEAANQHGKAEPLYRSELEQARKRFGPEDPRTAWAMAKLGQHLVLQKKHAEAEKLLRDCVRICEKAQPADWTTFYTRSMLGEALLGQKKPAEAEPLLVKGYDGMKQRQAKIPPRTRTVRLKEALNRLVALYDATGKKDEAARYRKELEALAGADKEKPKK